jgi:uncharacterized repeat protein (TIGR03803 family)
MKTTLAFSNRAGRWFGAGLNGGISGSVASTLTEPVSGRQPVLVLLMRLLLAAVLALPVFGAQAGVVFTSLYSFTGTNDGANPYAGLVQGSDGNFYGTTFYGGTNGWGTVFKISTNGALTTLYSFGYIDGANPQAGLTQGSDGNFYGTTAWGGTNGGNGTVFKISTNGALTSLYSFTGGDDGASPNGLVQGSDGNFYGTTSYGGNTNRTYFVQGCGTVFKISPNGFLTSLYSFNSTNDGDWPEAGLVQGRDGNFYGTTSDGGTNGYGTVFKVNTNGALTTLYSFGGARPNGLVQGSDGNFYGTRKARVSSMLGAISYGTVFKASTNGALTTLYSFADGNDGANPEAGLVQGTDGNFYGTTEFNGYRVFGFDQAGYFGAGTVFKISANGVLTTLYAFGSITNASGAALDGANPSAALVQGTDGSFYGTTGGGGTNDAGTVFRLTIVPEPQLIIIPYGANVILTWPTNAFVFTLKSSTDIGTSAYWNTNSLSPVVIGGQNVVVSPISNTQMFFRLFLAP